MANKLAQFGNELHSGQRSFGFVPKRRRWLTCALVLVILAALVPVVRGGFNLGIEFRGGSEFTVSQVANPDIAVGQEAVEQAAPEATDVRVTNIAAGTVRAQMGELTDDQTLAVGQALQKAYGVGADQVTSSFVGPTWGAGVTQQALIGLAWFILLVMVGMALYFRTWKMSVSAIAGLVFTIVTTVGLYALVGFEITPSAIIGFLTVLSYSLYDTVVVFDKIRENTDKLTERTDSTFAEQVNLAVNQTLVRSINTSIVGILPVGSILFIGALLLGAGTLKDLSLALFVGIIIGTLGTLFVAAPAYAALRLREKNVREHTARVEDYRAGRLAPATHQQDAGEPAGAPVAVTVNQLHFD
ncbi:protein translocase subunit SecF [Rothia nasisuis]|uniref:protein translocase subunit SecF n=1 Tax=Rothia nasisuis TaxID=2109647 RepID=UPI001F00A408|nr:protein translocase subunit SecF [Rothia nasisuis]